MDADGKDKKEKRGAFPLYLAAAAAAAVVYAAALGNGFVFDDNKLILADPAAYSFSRLPGHFTGAEGFFKSMGPYYRPLVAVTYGLDELAAEAFCGGLDPGPFHLTNIAVHVLATLLVLRLLLLLFRNRAAALVGALLFAVHPVHTEAVTWISGRTDGLAGLFFFAAFTSYVRFSSEGRDRSLKWVFLFLAAALLSKEMAVTFPAAALLFELTLGRGGKAPVRRRAAALAGLAAVTLLFLVVRWAALAHVPDREAYHYFYGKSPAATAATMVRTLPVYARLLVFPSPLLYHYNGVLPFQDSFLAGPVLFALLFVALSLGAAFFFRRRRPALSFAVLFFFLSLLPVMNIVPTMTLMAERFLYIPSLALSIVVADLLALLFGKKEGWSVRKEGVVPGAAAAGGSEGAVSTRAASGGGPKTAKVLAAAAAASVILVFGGLATARNRDWKDNDSLYLSAEGVDGTVLDVNLGNHYARLGDLRRAETLYRKALEIKETTMQAHLNLGVLYIRKGDGRRAAADLAAQRGDGAGAVRLRAAADRDFRTAEKELLLAGTLDPLSPDPLYTLAVLYYKLGRKEESLRCLDGLGKLEPDYPGADRLREALR